MNNEDVRRESQARCYSLLILGQAEGTEVLFGVHPAFFAVGTVFIGWTDFSSGAGQGRTEGESALSVEFSSGRTALFASGRPSLQCCCILARAKVCPDSSPRDRNKLDGSGGPDFEFDDVRLCSQGPRGFIAVDIAVLSNRSPSISSVGPQRTRISRSPIQRLCNEVVGSSTGAEGSE